MERPQGPQGGPVAAAFDPPHADGLGITAGADEVLRGEVADL